MAPVDMNFYPAWPVAPTARDPTLPIEHKFLNLNRILVLKTQLGLYNFRKETHGRRYSTYVQ